MLESAAELSGRPREDLGWILKSLGDPRRHMFPKFLSTCLQICLWYASGLTFKCLFIDCGCVCDACFEDC